MNRLLRAPSPALVVSLIALFVALGGTAYASGLISGSQIKNHSIPAKKLTRSAVKSLHGLRGPIGPLGPKGDVGPQGPGAISFLKGDVPAVNGGLQVITTSDGLHVEYKCYSSVFVALLPTPSAVTLFASGDKAEDGTLTSIQTSGGSVIASGTSTANLDVIAWPGDGDTISRFDLGGYYNGVNGCNIWGSSHPAPSPEQFSSRTSSWTRMSMALHEALRGHSGTGRADGLAA